MNLNNYKTRPSYLPCSASLPKFLLIYSYSVPVARSLMLTNAFNPAHDAGIQIVSSCRGVPTLPPGGAPRTPSGPNLLADVHCEVAPLHAALAGGLAARHRRRRRGQAARVVSLPTAASYVVFIRFFFFSFWVRLGYKSCLIYCGSGWVCGGSPLAGLRQGTKPKMLKKGWSKATFY